MWLVYFVIFATIEQIRNQMVILGVVLMFAVVMDRYKTS